MTNLSVPLFFSGGGLVSTGVGSLRNVEVSDGDGGVGETGDGGDC